MKVPSMLRPDLSKIKDQKEINEKLLFSLNKNFESLYQILQKKVDLTYNLDGTLIESFSVIHDSAINLPHKLPRFAKNLLVLGGSCQAKGLITSSAKNSSTAKFWLPSAVFLKVTGSNFFVSDPDGFSVGDTVRIGTADYQIATITGNLITFVSDPSVTVFEDTMYIRTATINIFVF